MIIILISIVIVLLVLGGISLHYNRIISQRNEQLLRPYCHSDDRDGGDDLLIPALPRVHYHEAGKARKSQ